jgi:urease accessory protein
MITATTVQKVHADTSVDATITLDFLGRHRRRCLLTTDCGAEFLLQLPRTTLLHQGDILPLSDGRCVEVREKPEHLVEISLSSLALLLKVAWHLGNAHCTMQIYENSIRIRFDAVLKHQLEHLGAEVQEIHAPFSPHSIGHSHDDR